VYFSETSSASIYINTTIKDNAENSNNSNYITNINVFFFPLILILILLIFITILYSYYSFNNRKIINKRRRFRKRRILNVIFIPTISILVIIIFILPFIYSQTFIYLLPFQNKGNEQTSIALKPSITFYSINGSLITNEDLLDHVVLIEFVVAQTIHGKTFTQQLVAIQKDINDEKVIFITIDIENTISETDFKEIYYTELGVNWEIGYNIDKTDRECGVEGKPYSLVILKKDNSIGSQYYEFISTDLVEKQIREYL